MTNHQIESRGSLRGAAVLFAVAPALAILVSAHPQDAGSDIGATRAKLERWIEIERVLSKERADWALGRQMLESRTELVRQEIDALRTRIEDARSSLAEADGKRAELLAERSALDETSAGLVASIERLEARVRGLLTRLPAPIAEVVRPLSQALPREGSETKLGLGARYQNAIGILNQVDRFHREITVAPEVLTLPDGRSLEVSVLYAGIAMAWFATPDGVAAGVGAADETGWEWSPVDASAAEIAAAVSILQAERMAEFVALPIDIR